MKSRIIFVILFFSLFLAGTYSMRVFVERRFDAVSLDSKVFSLYDKGLIDEFEKQILSRGWEFEKIQKNVIDQKSSPDLPKISILPIQSHLSTQVLDPTISESIKYIVPKIIIFRKKFGLIVPVFDVRGKKPGYVLLVPVFS